ncbi:DUF4255 domain-containing protein [Propioniciclava sinopodophylli]|uniref:DUF4255 domain-containing protein n=1 Tax=Propioniciclava sinopodophylli TaxID=1837344 RepID=UPI00249157D3|nr:DUF4255 domain-containing protein [Propioniciclava sinopodophylli]
MSNTLALAAVTSTIRYILERALAATHPGPVGSASVRTLRLDQLTTGDLTGTPGLNVLLYQVTPNHAGNLTDLPTRDTTGAIARRPNAALDLHYLITAFGDEASLEGQRLMARAIVALAAAPVLTRDVIVAARTAHQALAETAFLSASNLEDQAELVKLSPVPLSLEDHTRLWGLFHEAPFQLSVAYRATVVLLEADVPTRTPKPVRTPVLTVTPGLAPVLTSLDAAPGVAPASGVDLTLHGSGLLRGPTTPTEVRVGTAPLTPWPSSTPTELHITLTDAVAAGIQAVRVSHVRPSPGPGGPPDRTLASSNALPVVVHPQVQVQTVDPDNVTFTLHPPLFAGQRAVLRLDPLPSGGDPLALAIDPVPPGGPPRPNVTVARTLIPNGAWLVRIETDGVGSIPEQTGDEYTGPRLDLA